MDTTSVVLKGTVDGTGSVVVSVKVNGVAATLSGNNWEREVSLLLRLNTFTVVVTDGGGNQNSSTIQVTK